ncbi:FAD-dependent oxidoreductase [Vermiphilus pyriformis]|nr:MAG: FAD-dependent oxidoreductase [Vermiphilus pyriformis]
MGLRILKILVCMVCQIVPVSIYSSEVKDTLNSSGTTFKNIQSTIQSIKNVEPVVIIGAGPAGLSASISTVRAGFKTLVIVGKEMGGQVNQIKDIENWPGEIKLSGAELGRNLYNHAHHVGAQFLHESVSSVDLGTWPFIIKTDQGKIIRPLSVLIATGGEPKKLAVPGVQEYWGIKGVGYCAICEAPFTKGQDVIVIGGSDMAVQRVMQLSVYAKSVTLLVREQKLQALQALIDQMNKCSNVKVLFNTQLNEIRGDDKRVTAVVVQNTIDNAKLTIPAQSVFFAIGYIPRSQLVRPWVDVDSQEYICLKGRSQCTSVPGVFAAGNVTSSEYGKAAVAAGEGEKAALDIINFLEHIGYNPSVEAVIKDNLFTPPAVSHIQIPVIEDIDSFKKLINTNNAVLVEVFNPLCSVCQEIGPALNAFAESNKDNLTIVKINISRITPDFQKYLNIPGVPLIIIYEKGAPIIHKTIESSAQLTDVINQYLANKAKVKE